MTDSVVPAVDRSKKDSAGSAAAERERLQTRFYPETAVGGFSQVDGSIDFWSRIAALIRPDFRVLDYGAGRGAYIDGDRSPYRRALKILRGRVAEVVGCDIDAAVRDNPYLDRADVIRPGEPLPYEDGSFDLVIANWVFEHVERPEEVARELLRITKPGGWIAAATANRWGYVALIASLVPNRRHAAIRNRISPDVHVEDVFPTRYRMNTRARLRALFGRQAHLTVYTRSGEPAYHFNNAFIYRLAKLLHGALPSALATGLYMFARKR